MPFSPTTTSSCLQHYSSSSSFLFSPLHNSTTPHSHSLSLSLHSLSPPTPPPTCYATLSLCTQTAPETPRDSFRLLLPITTGSPSITPWLWSSTFPLGPRRRFSLWSWTPEANSPGFSVTKNHPGCLLQRRPLTLLAPPLSLISLVLTPFANRGFPILPSPPPATRTASVTTPTSTPTVPTPREISSEKNSLSPVPFLPLLWSSAAPRSPPTPGAFWEWTVDASHSLHNLKLPNSPTAFPPEKPDPDPLQQAPSTWATTRTLSGFGLSRCWLLLRVNVCQILTPWLIPSPCRG